MTAKECGIFIAELRKEKKLTQKQLADKLNVSDKAVSRWETGKGYPDVNTLVCLSEFFGITVNELLAGKRLEKEELTQIADSNVINAIITKEKEIKKKKLQTAIVAIVFCVLTIPPAIPTFVYIIDSIMISASFENATEFIVMLLVAVLLFVSGFVISKEHISLLHSYHYRNVTDRDGYCNAIGKTTMLMGIPVLICSATCLFPSVRFVEIAGEAVLLSGLIIGCAYIFKIQYKYNGGLF